MKSSYVNWDRDVKNYISVIWGKLAESKLISYATDIFVDISLQESYIQKLYLALIMHFRDILNTYEDLASIKIKCSMLDIYDFLRDKSLDYVKIDTNSTEIVDIFIYLDTSLIKQPYGMMNAPFYIGIQCIENDFIEHRITRIGALDIVKFSASEINRNIDKCIELIQYLYNKNFDSLSEW